MNICILGYYNLADGYLAFGNTVRETGNELSFFPFMSYLHNKIPIVETLNNFLSCNLNKENLNFSHSMIIPKTTPDILLLWVPAIDVSDIITEIKKTFKGLIIMHNWDPNYTEIDHPHWIQQKANLLATSKVVDYVLTVNPLEVEFYKNNNIKALHCFSGFDEKYSYPEDNDSYKCDVSAVITNLYTDSIWDLNKQKVNRKALIDQIYNDKSINLKIYGPPSLKNIYPDSYVSFINYMDCNKVFSNSKINLCIHAISIDGYLSERAPQIIGSKGLLFIDNLIGLDFIPGEDYIIVDKSNPFKQIKDLLSNEELRQNINNNGYNKRNSLKWTNLLNQIEQIFTNKITI